MLYTVYYTMLYARHYARYRTICGLYYTKQSTRIMSIELKASWPRSKSKRRHPASHSFSVSLLVLKHCYGLGFRVGREFEPWGVCWVSFPSSGCVGYAGRRRWNRGQRQLQMLSRFHPTSKCEGQGFRICIAIHIAKHPQ